MNFVLHFQVYVKMVGPAIYERTVFQPDGIESHFSITKYGIFRKKKKIQYGIVGHFQILALQSSKLNSSFIGEIIGAISYFYSMSYPFNKILVLFFSQFKSQLKFYYYSNFPSKKLNYFFFTIVFFSHKYNSNS